MHITQQIISNQQKYENEIINFFSQEYNNTKKELLSILSEDKFIIKEKEKWIKKFNKKKAIKSIEQYFFLNSKRNDKYYVWWDDKNQEVLILTYGKK